METYNVQTAQFRMELEKCNAVFQCETFMFAFLSKRALVTVRRGNQKVIKKVHDI